MAISWRSPIFWDSLSWVVPTENQRHMSDSQHEQQVLAAVSQASEQWKNAFNSGDAAGCAANYEDDATMHARPFGTFTGTEAIQTFWQGLIDGGYSDVEYIEPNVEVISTTEAILTSKWKMNKASGVIHKELWVIQENGVAKLREDDFEAIA